MRHASLVLALTLGLLATACGRASFQTPSHFARLGRAEPYQQRATSSQGVVLAVRKIKVDEPASVGFWSDAISQRLSGNEGYALLESREVRAKSGHAGKLLCFGRDQNGHTFDYWVAVYPHGRRLYLFEAGGRRDRFTQAKAEVERAVASLKIR